ncbi:uncharacterized protein K452DRAFT_300600 [Aplosporella prunicola CBS 121167]|uniref:Uncharacterized protein n=1 Tax=Aplosporella prunicola CBS 121167 TaxID=1176127 RepID=A0A6A6B8A6_9PEZI|nr:uncharacterized protein K452DRAFT_300600 [Aplosporella prunicola CBS 121167]KAF2139021.1 hypothetical protein K452DRAFT_300600 [Aplosporella prunicola CBS 121167]
MASSSSNDNDNTDPSTNPPPPPLPPSRPIPKDIKGSNNNNNNNNNNAVEAANVSLPASRPTSKDGDSTSASNSNSNDKEEEVKDGDRAEAGTPTDRAAPTGTGTEVEAGTGAGDTDTDMTEAERDIKTDGDSAASGAAITGKEDDVRSKTKGAMDADEDPTTGKDQHVTAASPPAVTASDAITADTDTPVNTAGSTDDDAADGSATANEHVNTGSRVKSGSAATSEGEEDADAAAAYHALATGDSDEQATNNNNNDASPPLPPPPQPSSSTQPQPHSSTEEATASMTPSSKQSKPQLPPLDLPPPALESGSSGQGQEEPRTPPDQTSSLDTSSLETPERDIEMGRAGPPNNSPRWRKSSPIPLPNSPSFFASSAGSSPRLATFNSSPPAGPGVSTPTPGSPSSSNESAINTSTAPSGEKEAPLESPEPDSPTPNPAPSSFAQALGSAGANTDSKMPRRPASTTSSLFADVVDGEGKAKGRSASLPSGPGSSFTSHPDTTPERPRPYTSDGLRRGADLQPLNMNTRRRSIDPSPLSLYSTKPASHSAASSPSSAYSEKADWRHPGPNTFHKQTSKSGGGSNSSLSSSRRSSSHGKSPSPSPKDDVADQANAPASDKQGQEADSPSLDDNTVETKGDGEGGNLQETDKVQTPSQSDNPAGDKQAQDTATVPSDDKNEPRRASDQEKIDASQEPEQPQPPKQTKARSGGLMGSKWNPGNNGRSVDPEGREGPQEANKAQSAKLDSNRKAEQADETPSDKAELIVSQEVDDKPQGTDRVQKGKSVEEELSVGEAEKTKDSKSPEKAAEPGDKLEESGKHQKTDEVQDDKAAESASLAEDSEDSKDNQAPRGRQAEDEEEAKTSEAPLGKVKPDDKKNTTNDTTSTEQQPEVEADKTDEQPEQQQLEEEADEMDKAHDLSELASDGLPMYDEETKYRQWSCELGDCTWWSKSETANGVASRRDHWIKSAKHPQFTTVHDLPAMTEGEKLYVEGRAGKSGQRPRGGKKRHKRAKQGNDDDQGATAGESGDAESGDEEQGEVEEEGDVDAPTTRAAISATEGAADSLGAGADGASNTGAGRPDGGPRVVNRGMPGPDQHDQARRGKSSPSRLSGVASLLSLPHSTNTTATTTTYTTDTDTTAATMACSNEGCIDKLHELQGRNQSLSNDRDALEEDVKGHLDTIETITRDKKELEGTIEDLRKTLVFRDQQDAAHSNQLNEQAEAHIKLEKENERLKHELHAAQKSCQDANAGKQAADERADNMERARVRVEKDFNDLAASFHALRDSVEREAQDKHQQRDYDVEISQLAEDVQNLKRDLDFANYENSELRTENEALKEKNDMLQQQRAEEADEEGDRPNPFRTSLNSVTSVASLSEELSACGDDDEDDEDHGYDQQFEEMQGDIDILNDEKQRLEKERIELNQLISTRNGTILQKDLSINDLTDQRDQLQRNLEALQSRTTNLEQQLTESSSSLAAATETHAAALADIQQATNTQLEELRAAIATKDSEMDGLQTATDAQLAGLHSTLTAKDSELDDLRKRLDAAEASAAEHTAAITSNSSKELDELRSALATKDSEINDLRSRLDAAEAAAAAHTTTSNTNSNELASLRSALTSKDGEIQAFRLRLADAEEAIAQADRRAARATAKTNGGSANRLRTPSPRRNHPRHRAGPSSSSDDSPGTDISRYLDSPGSASERSERSEPAQRQQQQPQQQDQGLRRRGEPQTQQSRKTTTTANNKNGTADTNARSNGSAPSGGGRSRHLITTPAYIVIVVCTFFVLYKLYTHNNSDEPYGAQGRRVPGGGGEFGYGAHIAGVVPVGWSSGWGFGGSSWLGRWLVGVEESLGLVRGGLM